MWVPQQGSKALYPNQVAYQNVQNVGTIHDLTRPPQAHEAFCFFNSARTARAWAFTRRQLLTWAGDKDIIHQNASDIKIAAETSIGCNTNMFVW